MIFDEAGPGWSKLVIFVIMMNDGVVTCNAWIKSNTSFTICSATKGLQSSWNKDKGEYTGDQAWLKLSKDRAFSIIGLAVHDLAVMADSVISGLKPFSLPLAPHPASSSVLQQLSCLCHHRLMGSSPAMVRSAFDFCHYTICSIQQLPLQP